MTETIAYIRNSLKDIYPPGEAQALVRSSWNVFAVFLPINSC